MIWYAWHVISWFVSSTFWQRCWLLITNPQREIRRNISPQKMLGLPSTNFWQNFPVTKFWRGGESRPFWWYPPKRLAASKSHTSIHSTSNPRGGPNAWVKFVLNGPQSLWISGPPPPPLNFFVAPEKWGVGLLSNWAGNFSGAMLSIC